MVGVNYVFHAAALKQVPSCEFFPMEAVRTNVQGTDNMLHAAIEAKVKRVVCLSTDKAAYPINAMGISKAMMERVVYANARVADSVYYKCSYGDGYLPSQWYSKVLDEHRVLKPEEMDTVYYHTNYFYHGSKLSVTFIKCQTLKELTWPIILERDTVDRVLFYTLEELQDAHYIVEYK